MAPLCCVLAGFVHAVLVRLRDEAEMVLDSVSDVDVDVADSSLWECWIWGMISS